MSVVFYRKGNTHTVRGIKCELTVIRPEYFNGKLPEGWFFAPEDIVKGEEAEENLEIHIAKAREKMAKKKDIDTDGMQEGVKKEEDTEEVEEKVLKNPEIRQAAKDAGIENWKTARIETLKESLK